jgi:hypothetical protein
MFGLLGVAYLSGLRPPSTEVALAGAAACARHDLAAIESAASASSAQRARVERADKTGARGELLGYRVAIGLANGREFTVDLPPESFVAEQVGNLVVYGFDEPAVGSEIHAVDVATGCAQLLARPNDVVRSAVIDTSGHSLYVHSVIRSGRADAGVERINLASGDSEQVVAAARRDPSLGRGWETALIWSSSWNALAVEPCTMLACQTRILDVGSGTVRAIDGFHGPTIALTDSHLVTLGAGDDWPTQLLKIGFDGAAQVLATDVIDAALVERSTGEIFVQTTSGTRTVEP